MTKEFRTYVEGASTALAGTHDGNKPSQLIFPEISEDFAQG